MEVTMSDVAVMQRVERDIERYKDDIERVLGPGYQDSERYKQLLAEVAKGRSVISVVLDLRGL
jgi:hypothetical protein